jgi:hypothetical protein
MVQSQLTDGEKSQLDWWALRHKTNCIDLIKYISMYFEGVYSKELMMARIKDYEREYIEAKPE